MTARRSPWRSAARPGWRDTLARSPIASPRCGGVSSFWEHRELLRRSVRVKTTQTRQPRPAQTPRARPVQTTPPRSDRLLGALLGAAVGDALGLPAEGLKPATIARSFEPLDRYRLLGSVGLVSDDTEQSVLIATALCGETDDDVVVRRFRRSMVGWFWRLPFGIGLSTLRACLKLSLGRSTSGVRSAGNGAAMRAPALGVALAKEPERRRALGRRLAEVTHTHPAGIDGARFCAELAALCAQSDGSEMGTAPSRWTAMRQAALQMGDPQMVEAVCRAGELAESGASPEEVRATLGTTGWVVHSVGICAWAFVAHEGMDAVRAVIRAGGDTDTHAAIVGAWIGALHGPDILPRALVTNLQPGPFGRAHIEALAAAVESDAPPPRFSATLALLRNLSLYPVVIAHVLWRLVRR
ncbi:MAG: ADP-ribosylglycohydrolase family protein [Deltaproteobacteria bacterium]|nr:ADP-ribosylglycohydrolase family protein [Deltaproteobacteria bacterium]